MLKNERGSGLILVLLILSLIIIISSFIIEWYHTVTLRNTVETELTRALRISVDVSMIDGFRKDCISMLNPSIANNEFIDFLKGDLGLDSSYTKMQGDKAMYKLNFSKIEVKGSPAEFLIEGFISKRPLLFNVAKEIEIPFSIIYVNGRLEDMNE